MSQTASPKHPFLGTPENAAKSQIWIVVSVYVLVAIVNQRLNLDASLFTLLQILSLALFKKVAFQQTLTNIDNASGHGGTDNQLNLFD